MSALYAVVDPGRGRLRYANMGHPHAFVVRKGGDVRTTRRWRASTRHGGRAGS